MMLIGGVVSVSKAQKVKPPPPENTVKIYYQFAVPISISEVLDLSVSPSNVLNFNFTSTDQIDAGITQLAAQTLTFKSNKDFYITIKGVGNTTNFSGGSAGSPMPVSMLKYKLSGSSTWIPISDSPQPFYGSIDSKIMRGTGTIIVDFLMDPTYFSFPGQDYSVTIYYNIHNQ